MLCPAWLWINCRVFLARLSFRQALPYHLSPSIIISSTSGLNIHPILRHFLINLSNQYTNLKYHVANMSLIKKCEGMCCKTLISNKCVFNCVSLPYFTLLCNLKMNIIVFISFILCSNFSWNCSLKDLVFCPWNIHKYSWKIININININLLAFVYMCR